MTRLAIGPLAAVIVAAACAGKSAPPAPGPAVVPADARAADDAAGPCAGPPPAADAVCVQDCGPPVVRAGDPEPGWRWLTPAEAESRARYGCPRCLPPDALVATPDGDVPIAELAAGAPVWTLDGDGARVAARVVLVRSLPARPHHEMVRVTLDDGRVVTASPKHPLADGRWLAALRPGDRVGDARVTAAEVLPYAGDRTWDLLVSGPTGLYLADGVPMRSTIHE